MTRPALTLGPLLWLVCAAACASAPAVSDGVFPMPGDEAERPRLRYRDGQVSLNDSCMVQLGNPLNASIPPFYVNGRPLGFC